VTRAARPVPRLVALSPGDLEPSGCAAFLRRAAAALDAGLPGLCLREAELEDGAYLELFLRLREHAPEAWLAVHDRAHLARLAPADALHLGFRSLPPAEATRGRTPPIGISTHASDLAPEALESFSRAAYLFHGPVRDTPSKRGWQEPIGWAGLARGVRELPRPVVAIGGMRPEDGPEALRAGALGIAVRSGILGSPDPAAATRRYLEAFG